MLCGSLIKIFSVIKTYLLEHNLTTSSAEGREACHVPGILRSHTCVATAGALSALRSEQHKQAHVFDIPDLHSTRHHRNS